MREPLAEIHSAGSTGASSLAGPAASNSGRIGLVILIVILGVGALLRLYNLGEKGLWTDEFFILVGSRGDFQGVLDFSRADTHPAVLQLRSDKSPDRISSWRKLREKAQDGDPILPGIFMSRIALEYYLPQASGAQVRLLPFAETPDDFHLALDRERRVRFATSFWDRVPACYRSVIEDELPPAIRVEGLERYGDIVIRYRE